MSSVIILGTSRSDGNTRKVCDYLLAQHSELSFFDLNDYKIAYYDYEYRNHNDDYISLIDQLLKYDTFIFATPVYWYSMSAQMKTFFDRLSDLIRIHKDKGRQLRGKSIKVVCCSSNEEEYPEFWKPFERSADYLGMNYLGDTHTWVEDEALPDKVKNRLNNFLDI